jgi:enoyl-CoA hydratase
METICYTVNFRPMTEPATETASEKLLVERDSNGITVIMFNRPQVMNALDLETMTQFAQAVDAMQSDAELRAVILTGAGEEAFCSGGDLHELSALTSEADARDFITIMGDALLKLERLPVPVIAAINGYALGGGSEVAVACDMRIMDDQTRLGFVQIRLGLTPGWGAGQRLMRLVGYSRAMGLLLQGKAIFADEIDTLGLATRIVEQGTALDYALDFAGHIAKQSPEVVRGVKALLRAGLEHPYEEALQIERDIFPPLWASDAHLRAVGKFLEKSREKKGNA